ncbi:glycosyltransferase family 4 protein [Bacillus mycoides]|uniref:glycosyltransferase family 4 protein n=1 Tax=Bacillus mycoides TaxID=1405 RepID=UPI0021116A65|nr:glycosyltransferase family 4 protein [Bacillus mycoides]MCQ6526094.1 glycosyltransferase family 4 protein [Bacillus mycoides]
MKILYVTTISNTVNAFLIPHIKLLIEQGHQVDVAFNIVQEVNPELIKLGCVIHNIEFQRSPLDRRNYSAYKKLKRIIQSEGYDMVHTHTPVASACVRLACNKIEGVKVMYTAHGFHFYTGAPLINWLVYYPVERWLAKYTDLLITINKEDYARAKNSFKAKRIEYIPGVGLNTKKHDKSVLLDKRSELEIPKDAIVVLSVGELNKNKNHEVVIKAMAKINNPNIFFVICGKGILEDYLKNLARDFGLEKQIKLLGFRKDIREICNEADIFAFPSFREGLSVALMEAMASGLPIVCSKIRGNVDLNQDEKGGYLVEPSDVDGFARAINLLVIDEKLRKQKGDINIKLISEFDSEHINEKMKKIYEEELY